MNRDGIDNKLSETAISGIIKVACHDDCYKNKKGGMIADTRTDPGLMELMNSMESISQIIP